MKMTVASLLAIALISAAGIAGAAPEKPAGDPGYAVVDKIPMPGEGGWDYVNVDAAARRIYVVAQRPCRGD